MILGDAIKVARTSANWTIEKLSKKSGLSTSEISRIEKGGDVSALAAEEIAQALEIPLWSLLKLAEGQENDFKELKEAQDSLIKTTIAIRHHAATMGNDNDFTSHN
jgi:transcriptional regulator with XRE-family HTH domain